MYEFKFKFNLVTATNAAMFKEQCYFTDPVERVSIVSHPGCRSTRGANKQPSKTGNIVLHVSYVISGGCLPPFPFPLLIHRASLDLSLLEFSLFPFLFLTVNLALLVQAVV